MPNHHLTPDDYGIDFMNIVNAVFDDYAVAITAFNVQIDAVTLASQLKDDTLLIKNQTQQILDNAAATINTARDNALASFNTAATNSKDAALLEIDNSKDAALAAVTQIKTDTQAIHDAVTVLRNETQALRDEAAQIVSGGAWGELVSRVEGLEASETDKHLGLTGVSLSESDTTAKLIAELTGLGVFNYASATLKLSWSYSANSNLTDTGFGDIELAGSVIEVFTNGTTQFDIRLTTATTGTGSGKTLFYTNNGDQYSPKWRKIYNSLDKPTAQDVGALPSDGKSADTHLLDGKRIDQVADYAFNLCNKHHEGPNGGTLNLPIAKFNYVSVWDNRGVIVLPNARAGDRVIVTIYNIGAGVVFNSGSYIQYFNSVDSGYSNSCSKKAKLTFECISGNHWRISVSKIK